MWAKGIARHSCDEVDIIGREAIDAIDALLTSSTMKKFLFGDKPSSFDATLFSTLSGIVEI
jgi:glutathione S-transferase